MQTYVASCRSDRLITPRWMFFYRGYALGVYGFLIIGSDFEEVMKRAEVKARDYFPASEGWDKPIVGLDEIEDV